MCKILGTALPSLVTKSNEEKRERERERERGAKKVKEKEKPIKKT